MSANTMRAVVYKAYGAADVLHVADVPRPEPSAGELLVRVGAAEVTKADTELRSFRFPVQWFWLPLRLFFGVFKPRKHILGSYFAGVVEALGDGVERFKVGDRIYGSSGMGLGAYGEYVAVCATSNIGHMPQNLSFSEAAAVPLGGWNGLHFMNLAAIQPGHEVLINGAGGSIGMFALQVAKARGAQVTAVDASHKSAMLRDLGADDVIDYQRESFAARNATYDVVFDMVASSSFADCLAAVKPGGKLLLGNPRVGDMFRAFWVTKTTDKTVSFRFAEETLEELDALTAMLESGAIRPVLDSVCDPGDAADAHRRVEQEQRVGMVVLANPALRAGRSGLDVAGGEASGEDPG